MSDDALQTALLRLRAERLRFQGLPDETWLTIVEDAVAKIALLPEAQAWEESAIQGADGLVGMLLEAELGPASGIVVKGLDFTLHALLSFGKHKAQDMLSARQAQGLT